MSSYREKAFLRVTQFPTLNHDSRTAYSTRNGPKPEERKRPKPGKRSPNS